MWLERAEKLVQLVKRKDAPFEIDASANLAVQHFQAAQEFRNVGNISEATSEHHKGVSAYSKAESLASLNGVVKVEFTVLKDHDGYWLVEKERAKEVIRDPERFRTSAVKTETKIASCRIALERALAIGATELHLDGVGATNGVAQDIRKAGIKPFIYMPSVMTDLTSDWARKQVAQGHY